MCTEPKVLKLHFESFTCIVLKNKINTYNYLQKRKKIGSPQRDRLRVFESSGSLLFYFIHEDLGILKESEGPVSLFLAGLWPSNLAARYNKK